MNALRSSVFKVVGEDAYFLAWTTTPDSHIQYRPLRKSAGRLCKGEGSRWIRILHGSRLFLGYGPGKLAEEGNPAWRFLRHKYGTDLEYKEYDPVPGKGMPSCKRGRIRKASYYQSSYVMLGRTVQVLSIMRLHLVETMLKVGTQQV